MLFYRFVTILTLLLCMASQAHAKDITVVVDTWESYSNTDDTGYYLDILQAVFPTPDYTLSISHVPYKRALLMVIQGKADLTVGVAPGDMPGKFIVDQYLEVEKVAVVVKRETAARWQGLQSLKNKVVVAKIGYEFSGNFTVPIYYSEKSSLLSMLKMLAAGRVDAVLDYAEDIKKEWARAGLNDNFTILESVISNKVYPAFNTERQDLRIHFEKTFQMLVKAGTIRSIGIKYGLDPENLPQPE